jgi:hypothetical protein
MSVWREVQEALYQRWAAQWAATTPYQLGNEKFDPPAAPWCKVMIVGRPSNPGTMGGPGRRRVDRAGAVFIMLREPPGDGVGRISDLAEQARAVFEDLRLTQHDVRFSTGDIGDESEVDDGRWWGVTIEARFDYEDVR